MSLEGIPDKSKFIIKANSVFYNDYNNEPI